MTERRISESELILPVLYFLNKETSLTTSKLKSLLIDLFNPTGRDAQIAKNRSDTLFEQKVRNLVSHRTLEKRGYASYEKVDNDGIHCITESGKNFLQANIVAIEYLFSGIFNYGDIRNSVIYITETLEKKGEILVYDENFVVEEGIKRIKNVQIYERSKKLRDTAVDHYTVAGHIACSACDFDFYAVYGERGRGYIEIHHQKPLFQYEDQDIIKFIEQALQNVIPVCSNCHRMIHREKNTPLSIEDLRLLIQKT